MSLPPKDRLKLLLSEARERESSSQSSTPVHSSRARRASLRWPAETQAWHRSSSISSAKETDDAGSPQTPTLRENTPPDPVLIKAEASFRLHTSVRKRRRSKRIELQELSQFVDAGRAPQTGLPDEDEFSVTDSVKGTVSNLLDFRRPFSSGSRRPRPSTAERQEIDLRRGSHLYKPSLLGQSLTLSQSLGSSFVSPAVMRLNGHHISTSVDDSESSGSESSQHSTPRQEIEVKESVVDVSDELHEIAEQAAALQRRLRVADGSPSAYEKLYSLEMRDKAQSPRRSLPRVAMKVTCDARLHRKIIEEKIELLKNDGECWRFFREEVKELMHSRSAAKRGIVDLNISLPSRTRSGAKLPKDQKESEVQAKRLHLLLEEQRRLWVTEAKHSPLEALSACRATLWAVVLPLAFATEAISDVLKLRLIEYPSVVYQNTGDDPNEPWPDGVDLKSVIMTQSDRGSSSAESLGLRIVLRLRIVLKGVRVRMIINLLRNIGKRHLIWYSGSKYMKKVRYAQQVVKRYMSRRKLQLDLVTLQFDAYQKRNALKVKVERLKHLRHQIKLQIKDLGLHDLFAQLKTPKLIEQHRQRILGAIERHRNVTGTKKRMQEVISGRFEPLEDVRAAIRTIKDAGGLTIARTKALRVHQARKKEEEMDPVTAMAFLNAAEINDKELTKLAIFLGHFKGAEVLKSPMYLARKHIVKAFYTRVIEYRIMTNQYVKRCENFLLEEMHKVLNTSKRERKVRFRLWEKERMRKTLDIEMTCGPTPKFRILFNQAELESIYTIAINESNVELRKSLDASLLSGEKSMAKIILGD